MLAFSTDAARAVPRACPSTRVTSSTTPFVHVEDKARGWASPHSRLQLARCLTCKTRASLRFSQQRECAGQCCALRTGGSTFVWRRQETGTILLDHPPLFRLFPDFFAKTACGVHKSAS